MAEPFLGQISMFGFAFAPKGWAFCNGQLLSIAQNTALFSLLGTTYGGDGQTTFALPNLQSRCPLHFGQGAGLSERDLGEQGGVESVTLLTTQMPQHSHLVNAFGEDASTSDPSGSVPAAGGAYNGAPDGTKMNAQMNDPTGGGQPHDNMTPFLGINFCIALSGIFPSRN